MNIPRVYVPLELTVGEPLPLEGGGHRHLATVLRLSPGAKILVFNGTGGQFHARVVAMERHKTILELLQFDDQEPESCLQITLAQAISRGDRMDYALQKAVELGVTRVLPLLTRRSAHRLDGDRHQKRMRHWHAVMVAACEQSGRNRIPALEAPQRLESLLTGQLATGEPWFLLHPEANRSLSSMERPKGAVTVIVGAEGGWDQIELEAMTNAGIVGVRLGPRILRTETAATVAVAALQLLWGDLG